MAELLCVSPAQVHEFWPHVEGSIRKAVRRTNLGNTEEIHRQLLSGDALLWLAYDGNIRAAAITSLSLTDTDKICTLVACSGDGMSEWIGLIAGIEQYAKDEGCAAFRIFGRSGWLRALEGYRLKHVIIEKRL